MWSSPFSTQPYGHPSLKSCSSFSNQKQSNARHSDQDFYDRTVAALEAKAKAKLDIGTDRDISRKLKEATSTQDSADLPTQRVPPEVVLSENHVEGRPKLKGGEKWDVSSGKESALGEKEEEKVKTEEEKDVELELNSILKRSPSTWLTFSCLT